MRGRKGFTLTEMLLVTAIFAVIVATALPAVARQARDLKVKQLNDFARAVYMTATDRLVSLNTAGKPVRFSDSEESPVCKGEAKCLYYCGSADGKSIIIEYVKDTPAVCFVYVSDDMSINELRGLYLSGNLVNEKFRLINSVGCYGGEPTDWKKGTLGKVKPKLKIVNSVDLYAEISCEYLPNGATVILNLSNEFDNVDIKINTFWPDLNHLDDTVLLDSILPGGSSMAMNYRNLIKAEVTAVLTVSADGISASSDPVKFDPLYESRGEKISVANARHLSNLRYTSSYSAVQTADILFNDVDGSCFMDGENHDLKIYPLPNLYGSFDGGGYIIKNLNLIDESDDFGLFKSISGRTENIHIAGNVHYNISNAKNVGILCSELESGGYINNCSVSEVSIDLPSGTVFGGLCGQSGGKIENSSAVLGEVRLGSSCTAGGVVGMGGEVSACHSAGKFVSDEDCSIFGVGSQCSALNCYSECTTGYIAGSKFYGISENPSIGSFFAVENAWLTRDYLNGARYDDLNVQNFKPALTQYVDGELVYGEKLPPESVTFRGIPCRFGASNLAEPRGTVGLLKVTFNGENYSTDLIKCFDGYGNMGILYPLIEWGSPSSGEERWFVFRSDFAFPEGGDDGFEIGFSGELGDEFQAGTFLCREILESGTLDLRFGEFCESVEVEIPKKDGPKVGKYGVMMCELIFDWDSFYRDPESSGLKMMYSYRFFDPADGNLYTVHEENSNRLLPEIEAFKDDLQEYESAVYVFAEKGVDYEFSSDFGDPIETIDFEGFEIVKFYQGYCDDLYEDHYAVSVSIQDEPEITVGFRPIMGSFDILWNY